MKKILAVILSVLMLTGCQLAGEEAQEDQFLDKMVGVFVTFESLDLDFDIQALLEDHPYALHGDGVDISDPKYVEYAGKLPVTVTEDGWELPGYEGVFYGRLLTEGYSAEVIGDGIGDVESRIYIDDGEAGFKVEGIIYFTEGTYVEFYTNPVYMNEAGEYYVVHGDGCGVDVGLGGTSMTVEQELKWTENGEKKAYHAEFSTTVRGVTLVEKVKLIWMNEARQEISRIECTPGELPESIDAAGDCLVVIEERRGVIVSRNEYQPGDESVTMICKNDDEPWCCKKFMQINWPE